MDFGLALTGLVALSPLAAIITLLIKLDSQGPAIFSQKRVGLDGQEFLFFKFRSMVENAEALKPSLAHLNETDPPAFKMESDPRITRVGKVLRQLNFDEIPQLWNILKGEMSFVGPRPLPINEASQIKGKYQARHALKPGLSSYWFVGGQHKLSFKKWMELDLAYLEDISFSTDLSILGKTASIIFLESILRSKKNKEKKK